MKPRISFGILVLNGEPFVRYLLRTLYPYAHQILVSEGACPGAVGQMAGRSTDGTLETLTAFQRHEDPDAKLQIITREGLWPEKTEQCQAFAERADGDYLWVCGIDEFYTPQAIETVARKLELDPAIDMLSFDQVTFWGSPGVWVDGWYLHRGWVRRGIPRVFRWGPGYRYVDHRPDTVVDPRGVDLRSGCWLDSRETSRWGVRTLHYSLLLPTQVEEKAEYYRRAVWAQRHDAARWVESCWWRLDHPYRVHNAGGGASWLQHYGGEQPPAIVDMWNDITTGVVDCRTRPMDDVEALLASPRYRLGRSVLRGLQPAATLAFTVLSPVVRPLVRLRRRRRAGVEVAGSVGADPQPQSRAVEGDRTGMT